MKNGIKILTLILALMMLISILASCSRSSVKGEESSAAQSDVNDSSDGLMTDPEGESSTEDDRTAVEQSGLEIKDMGGQEFNIWNSIGGFWSPTPMDVTEKDNLSDVINKAGYSRNQRLIRDLNIKLSFANSDTDPSNQSAKNYDKLTLSTLWQSGIEKYDIVFTGAYPSASLAIEGFYMDLSQSEFIHTDAKYYESQVNEQVKFYDRQFFAMGFYSEKNTRALEATFVNSKILDSITKGTVTIDDLYALALDNKWTMEKLLELGNMYAIDTNTGNIELDQYSAIVSYNGAHSIYYWLGGDVIGWNEASNRYNCTLNSASNVNLLEWIRENVTKDTRFGLVKNDKQFEAFIGGAAAFLITDMSNIDQIMNASGLEWAILPPPCYEEGDDYRSFSTGWNINFAGIPSACVDFDKSAYLYEMFMCFSYDYVYPAYYEKCFETQYMPDATSAQVFDLIAHSRYVDIDNVYSLGASYRIKGLIQSDTASIPETLLNVSTSISNKLVELKKTFENNGSK